MKLREMSFTSMRSLVAFANYRKITPEGMQGIYQGIHPNKNLSVTLLFWDDAQRLPPLEELSDVLDDGSTGSFTFGRPIAEVLPIEEDPKKANLAYTRAQFVTEDAKGSPEKIIDYLDRKDRERLRLENIERIPKNEAQGEEKREVKEEESKYIEASLEEKNKHRSELWEQVKTLWAERHPGIALSLEFEQLSFEGSTIYIPMYSLGPSPEGAVFYNLSLIMEEVFGQHTALEYL